MTAHKRSSAVPFALTADGRLIDVSGFESGLLTDGVCPECGELLVAKKGSQRIHHFAHHAKTNCVGALETSLHKAAKQVLVDAAKNGTAFFAPAYGNSLAEKYKYRAIDQPLLSVDCEKTVFIPGQHRRPDVLAEWEAGKLAIEVCVTNPMDEDRIHFYEQAGLDCIEISLAHLAKQFVNGHGLLLAEVSDAVLRNPEIREWRCRAEWVCALIKADGSLDDVLPHFGKYTVGTASASTP